MPKCLQDQPISSNFTLQLVFQRESFPEKNDKIFALKNSESHLYS